MTDLVVAGAGMAGLVAAARARELGARVEVYEKAGRVGGSMLLSSGVIWRYADFETFRRECPDGDLELQRLVHERLDEDMDWLERLGAVVTERGTGNPLTAGRRFDTRSICAALLQADPVLRLTQPLARKPDAPLVLATGGFQADAWLVREWITAEPLMLRSSAGSQGDGLRLGIEAGGVPSAGMDQFYGRAMPAVEALHESHWVPAAQLYAKHARAIEGASGARFTGEIDWSELRVVQWIARQPGARAWFVIPGSAMESPGRYGTVRESIDRAAALGAAVEEREGGVAVQVRAAITQTLGGLRVDTSGAVVGADGIWAAGGDIGGVATGGYMSNLAAALVIGKRAAEAALR